MNINDYIRWRGEITFKQSQFNEVDNLILSQLAYINWSGVVDKQTITLKKAWDLYQTKIDNELSMYEECCSLAANSNRFKDLKLSNYSKDINKETEKQFGAITFQLPDKSYYVAFEGTDNSLVGWKEDFNMTFTSPIPAQIEAAEYFKNLLTIPFSSFRLGGHSKGGNLAVYAAVMSNKPNQIIAVYNNDGPGFMESFTNTEAYKQIEDKLISFIPQSSTIGRLLNNPSKTEIVKSNASNLYWQHFVFSWEIDVNRIVRMDKNTTESQYIQETMNKWNSDLSLEEKMVFINAVYDTLTGMGYSSFEEIHSHKVDVLKKLITKFLDFSDNSKEICISVLIVFFKSNLEAFGNTYVDKIIKKITKGNKNENTDR